jgi:hypothetical protein
MPYYPRNDDGAYIYKSLALYYSQIYIPELFDPLHSEYVTQAAGKYMCNTVKYRAIPCNTVRCKEVH